MSIPLTLIIITLVIAAIFYAYGDGMKIISIKYVGPKTYLMKYKTAFSSTEAERIVTKDGLFMFADNQKLVYQDRTLYWFVKENIDFYQADGNIVEYRKSKEEEEK